MGASLLALAKSTYYGENITETSKKVNWASQMTMIMIMIMTILFNVISHQHIHVIAPSSTI